MLLVLAPWIPQAGATEGSAKAILGASGVKGGLVVHIGCGEGKLTADLRVNENCLVQGLDGDAKNVEAARRSLRDRGLYGPVSVDVWKEPTLPYADNVVNLLVLSAEGLAPSAGEIDRVLAPLGVAMIEKGGTWQKLVKSWPADIDEWTHFRHGSDGNAVARDRVVGPPRHLQWIADPPWSRCHGGAASVACIVSAAGRLYSVVDHGPTGIAQGSVPSKWFIEGRDAFSGVLLWSKPLPGWDLTGPRGRYFNWRHLGQVVADGQQVYVAAENAGAIQCLEGATGKVLRTLAETKGAGDFVLCEGAIFAQVQPARDVTGLVSVAAKDGKVLWRRTLEEDIEPTTLTASGKYAAYQTQTHLVCLDRASGKELWRRAAPRWGARKGSGQAPVKVDGKSATGIAASGGTGAVVLHGDLVLCGTDFQLVCLQAADGKVLWEAPTHPNYHASPDVFVIGDVVWSGIVFGRGYDLRTGKVVKEYDTSKAFEVNHHHRCYRNKATERFLLTSMRGVETIDLQNGACEVQPWVRGVCRYGILPCNGLIYFPPHFCSCYMPIKLTGYIAMAPERAGGPPAASEPRLQKGPAFGLAAESAEPTAPPADPGDWPTYRRAAGRFGSTPMAVPAELKPLWTAKVGDQLTPPVVAEGLTVVADKDRHAVVAIDAGTGRPRWSFIAGGRVDSPPTLYRGLCLFGSADGWIYCLRNTDGAMVWRFRGVPQGERRIVVRDRLESAWPSHGSVLVSGGAVYATAGRSSFVEGGVGVVALDPVSGAIKAETTVSSGSPARNGAQFGCLSDVLVFEGETIHMAGVGFDASLKRKDPALHVVAAGTFLDGTWFNRTYWSVDKELKGGGGPAFKGNPIYAADLLVCDQKRIFGIQASDPSRPRDIAFGPGSKGYLLFASDRAPETKSFRWSQRVPIRAMAMTLADEQLFLAGPPDVIDPKDPWAAFEGRKGGMLRSASANDGRTLREWPLDAPPVFDGLIAAGGKLYMVTVDGKVTCLAGRTP